MDKLLTKKDLAERWQVAERTIDDYRTQGIITPVKSLPCIRYTLQQIQELEGVKLEKFSPLERKKLERENEELKMNLGKAESVIAKMQILTLEAIQGMLKEAK